MTWTLGFASFVVYVVRSYWESKYSWYIVIKYVSYIISIIILTLSWPVGHICPTYKESFQVRCDNSIPLFIYAAIYLEVSLVRWTSQNAFSHETALYKWYFKVDDIVDKKWDTVIPADLKRLFVSGKYTYVPLVTKGVRNMQWVGSLAYVGEIKLCSAGLDI
jgi:hypothetical protein